MVESDAWPLVNNSSTKRGFWNSCILDSKYSNYLLPSVLILIITIDFDFVDEIVVLVVAIL